MSDIQQRFLFEHLAIRGDLVQLDATWKAIREKHAYPEPVQQLLGEALVAALLLSATLKHRSRLTLQIQGNGPIPFLVVECTDENNVRGLAHYAEDVRPGTLRELVGDGRLAITLEPEQGAERYQSIVALSGDTLADALDDYLLRSEQLDTRIWLAVDAQRCAGLLIQKLPSVHEASAEDWNRIQHLSATISPAELLELKPREIIHRLYHEEDVRVFEPELAYFRCSCSKERVANMLRTLGYEEVQSILLEQDRVEVACEFCNQQYLFDAIDVGELFSVDVPHQTPRTRH